MALAINGTTGISGVNGTAAAPALAGADTDSGVFFGTNQVGLTTNGTQAVLVDANGRAEVLSAFSDIQTLTDGTTITADLATGNFFTVTLGGNRTLGNPTNKVPGQAGTIFVVQDGTGGRTLQYGSDWEFAGSAATNAPTLTTTANAVDRIDYVVRSSTSIHAVATLNYS